MACQSAQDPTTWQSGTHLTTLLQILGFQRWWADGDAPWSRTMVLMVPVYQRLLRIQRHPRIHLVVGSAEARAAHSRDYWRRELAVHAACGWCGQPTTNLCSGTPRYACRQPLCSACEPVFGRCERCAAYVGTPPRWISPEEAGVPEAGRLTESQWYRRYMDPATSTVWQNIWDGEVAVHDPAVTARRRD